MAHNADTPDETQPRVIDVDGGDTFEVVTSGDRFTVGRRGERYVIWDATERAVVRRFEGPRARGNAWVEFRALEGREHERRLRVRTRWSIAGGVAAAVVVLVGVYAIASIGRSPAEDIPQARPTETRFENAAGGYSLRIPAAWDPIEDGATTTLASPREDVTVVIAPAEDGDLEALATERGEDLTAGWTDVAFEPAQQRTVGDEPAVSISGSGTTSIGESVRFVAIAIETDGGNFSIAITVRAAADPAQTTPAIEGVLGSFKVAA